MKTGSQVAWVMVRMIGLILFLFSLTRLIAAGSSGYVAFTLRDHSAIVIRSDMPIPENQQDTPANRQLLKAHGQAKAAATLQGILFALSLAGGLYCLKGGRALQNLLMPPEEMESPNTVRVSTVP
jgi:hypothetical protein